jgi:hypothetical protein
MSDDVSAETRARVVTAIARAWDEGRPVAGQPEEIAPIAIRRWCSSDRRGAFEILASVSAKYAAAADDTSS